MTMHSRFLLFLVFLSIPFLGRSTHNRGGHITYKHLSGDRYEITVTTMTKRSAPADRPRIGIDHGDDTGIDSIDRHEITYLAGDYQINTYIDTHSYSSPKNYSIHVEDPNRSTDIINIPNSVNRTFYISSQLRLSAFSGEKNSSVQFKADHPILSARKGQKFQYAPALADPDGDCLSFTLVKSRGKDGKPIPDYQFPEASNALTIDPSTGLIEWDAPQKQGLYSFCIRVREWRNGELIGEVFKDLAIEVKPDPNSTLTFKGTSSWPVNANDIPTFALAPGDSLDLSCSFTDPDTNSNLDLSAFGEAFDLQDSASFQGEAGQDPVEGKLQWEPNSDHLRNTPYLFVIRGTTESGHGKDLPIQVYVSNGAAEPCRPTVSVQEPNADQNAGDAPFAITSPGLSGGQVTLKIREITQDTYQLKVFDQRGRQVHSFEGTERVHHIPFDDRASGLYLARVSIDGSVYTRKFVIDTK